MSGSGLWHVVHTYPAADEPPACPATDAAAAQAAAGAAGGTFVPPCSQFCKYAIHQLCARLQRQQPPELLRVPLEGVVLTVKATFGDGAAPDATLCRALTPPAQAAVAAAVANLKVERHTSQRLGAASAPLASVAAC
jgi:hypothetical protein